MEPGRWLHSLSRDQAMDAAIQLHRDVCLMATNLDVLDQYALSLQGTASKILELGLDSRGFPSAEVAAGALGPRVRRASVRCRRGRLPPDRWWPLAVAGGNHGVGCLFLKRVDVFRERIMDSVDMYKCLPGDDVNTRVLRC